jgi:hypothetical protein
VVRLDDRHRGRHGLTVLERPGDAPVSRRHEQHGVERTARDVGAKCRDARGRCSAIEAADRKDLLA